MAKMQICKQTKTIGSDLPLFMFFLKRENIEFLKEYQKKREREFPDLDSVSIIGNYDNSSETDLVLPFQVFFFFPIRLFKRGTFKLSCNERKPVKMAQGSEVKLIDM